MLARLQAAILQAEGNDCAGFSGPPVNSYSGLSIPSLRNDSLLLTILKKRSVEDEITDVTRANSQPGESFFKEVMLETDIRLKSFSGDISFTTSPESIFNYLSPPTASRRDKIASSLESMDQSRVEFSYQGGLEGQVSFGGLSSSVDRQLRDRSGIEIPKRFLRTQLAKKETRQVSVKRDIDPSVKLFLRATSGNGWDNICGGINGFSKIHACIAENCNAKKHILEEP